ncbi:MAG TPA: rhomboid family intramembrane serine protease [Longimicrobiales bacterium]|nr:rhomboid family intramembrane serine protease [Longimicrobiales bacterium]
MTDWVKRLLVANIAVFLVTRTSPGLFGDLAYYPPVAIFRPWTVVTYMFLHANLGHLFFNMIGLFFFGPRLESRLGSRGFLSMYFLAGVGGAAFQTAFASSAPMVGASGGIYGVLLGFAMYWPRERIIVLPIPVPVQARFVIGAYLVLSLLQGVGGLAAGTAHFAHLGGAAFAFAFLKWWEWRKGAAKRAFQRQVSPEPVERGFAADRAALTRWRGIPVDSLHELNRGEVERLVAKAEREGPAALSRPEREFLERMSRR